MGAAGQLAGKHGPAIQGMAERGMVLDAVNRCLESARRGRGGALFVVGPAGLGKTTVLEHAITLAKSQFAVGVGRGDRMEAILPFGLLGQALDQLLGQEGTASGDDGGEGADTSAQARFYAILRGVRRAAIRPLLVALDDLHWSDPDSLTAIHLLCRRLTTLPVALIATARPWPTETLTSAQDLAAQGLAEITQLDPLSSAAARALLSSRAGERVRVEVLNQAIGLCAGNPLLLKQVAGELHRSGELAQGRLLSSRFVAVGAAGQRYLRAASVLGVRFRAAIATQMAALSASQVAAELDGLFHSGLLHEAGEGWARFTHALMRQWVYEDIAPPVRQDLHAAAFRALLSHDANPTEAAEHAVAAQLAGDTAAVATLARAGRTALRAGAARAARRHLEAGVELAGPAPPVAMLFDLGKACNANGASEQAIDTYERLLGLPELTVAQRVAALRQLGQVVLLTGQVERAEACYASAVALAEHRHPDLAVAALLDHTFHHQLLFGAAAALPIATKARKLAGAHAVIVAAADAAWGSCAYRCGDPAGLAAAEAAAISTGPVATSLPGSLHGYWDPELIYAIAAVPAERFADAERVLAGMISSAELQCEPRLILRAMAAWTDGLCRLGRLAEALTLVERLDEFVELFAHTRPLVSAYRALVLLEQGHLAQASLSCEQSATRTHHSYSIHRADMLELHVRAVLAHRQGDAQTASDLFGQLRQLLDRAGEFDPAFLPWAREAMWAYLACGRHADAQGVIDWLQPRAAVLPSRWPRIVLATGRAALAELAGDQPLARGCFDHALDLHEGLPMPLERVATLTDYGAFLTRSGEPASARLLLAEALDIAEHCGAGWHADRARAEWRRAGGRARSAEPETLSPREAAVAHLARAGRTNREIAQRLYLSIKTVETHLGHVYQKLGLRGRWQLASCADLDTDRTPRQGPRR